MFKNTQWTAIGKLALYCSSHWNRVFLVINQLHSCPIKLSKNSAIVTNLLVLKLQGHQCVSVQPPETRQEEAGFPLCNWKLPLEMTLSG